MKQRDSTRASLLRCEGGNECLGLDGDPEQSSFRVACCGVSGCVCSHWNDDSDDAYGHPNVRWRHDDAILPALVLGIVGLEMLHHRVRAA